MNALAFSPDGKTLWSAGDDRAIFAWDLQRADTLVHQASPAVAAGPTLPFNSVDMIIGPDGRYVAYPSADVTSFRIRDVTTGALGPPSAEDDGRFMSFSPDGERYATVDAAGTAARLGDEDRRSPRRQRRQRAAVLVLPGGSEGRLHAGRAQCRGIGDERHQSRRLRLRSGDSRRARRDDARTGGRAGVARVRRPNGFRDA